MKVPLLDLKPQFAQFKDKIVPEVIEIMESQMFILGPKVEKMERELAEYIGAKYALGVSSGTDAILIALMALGLKPGDEIITSPYTFFATAGCIHRAGAKTVFVDIEPETFNIDPKKIEMAITPKTRAIMPVHLFGQCADMDAINEIAKKHNLPVIEDCAQAIGAKNKNRQAGNMSLAGCFSFFPSKNLGCFGDGGLVTTNDSAFFEKIKRLRMHGQAGTYIHTEVGINGRLDALQAAVISAKLPLLAGWSAARRANAARYADLFKGVSQVKPPLARPENEHIYNQYVVRVSRRDELKAHLAKNEIGCAVYYPLSLHEQECFKYLGYKKGDFPISEEASLSTLALPVFPELAPEQVEFVGKTIAGFFQS